MLPLHKALQPHATLIRDMLRPKDVQDHPLFHNPQECNVFMLTDFREPQVHEEWNGNECGRIVVTNGVTQEEMQQALLCYNYARFRANEAMEILAGELSDDAESGTLAIARQCELLLERAKGIEDILVKSLGELGNDLPGRGRSNERAYELSLVWRAVRRAVQRYDLLQPTRDTKASIKTFAASWIRKESKQRDKKASKATMRDGEIRRAAEILRNPSERGPETYEHMRRIAEEERRKGNTASPATKESQFHRLVDYINETDGVSEMHRVDDDVATTEIMNRLGSKMALRLAENAMTPCDWAEVFRILSNEPSANAHEDAREPSWRQYYHPILWERDWIEYHAVMNGDRVDW